MSGFGIGKQRLVNKIIETTWGEGSLTKKFNYDELLYILQEMNTLEGRPYLDGSINVVKYKILKDFMQYLLYRNLANYDSMILLTSEKGTGKSSAAMMMAYFWCKLIGIRFNPKRHIAYNNADVSNKIDILNKYEPLIADESIRFASSADWAKKENKELKKKLGQVRTKHLLYILCFPLKVLKLEKNYLESYVNYWIDLFGRGTGAIYVKDKNPAQDSWRISSFDKLGSYTEFSNLMIVENILKKHPNFWQIIKFPKPPEWLYTRYLSVREKNVYDDDNVMANITREDMINALLIMALRDIMTHDVNLTMNRIILHIKNEHGILVPKRAVEEAVEDARQLLAKMKMDGIDKLKREDFNGKPSNEIELE